MITVLMSIGQASASASAGGIDDQIDAAMKLIADAITDVVLYAVPLGGADAPLIVMWLIVGALFFTVYLKFINVSGMKHALGLVSGRHKVPGSPGEISAFRALTLMNFR